MWELTVTYRTEGHRSYAWGSLDEDIRKAARGTQVDQGTMSEAGKPRDLSFDFRTSAQVRDARERVLQLRRILQTDIHPAP